MSQTKAIAFHKTTTQFTIVLWSMYLHMRRKTWKQFEIFKSIVVFYFISMVNDFPWCPNLVFGGIFDAGMGFGGTP